MCRSVQSYGACGYGSRYWELEGAGILEAVGSANPCSEERYDTPESETFDGCCMAVIRAGEAAGEIHLTVTADDSVQKQLTILIQEAEC